MRRFFTGLFTALGSIMLIVALLIMSVEMFAVNPSFFENEYAKLGLADPSSPSYIGMNESDLKAATKALLEYTTGKRDSLEVEAVIYGQRRQVFEDTTEVKHMVDVRALYIGARDMRTAFFIGAAVLYILAFVLSGKKALKTLCKSFLWVSAGFVVAVASIAIYAASDFTGFWISFHHVFFSGNELWILDPAKSMLINMVPEQFFSDLVARIIIRFVSIFVTLNIAAIIGSALIKRAERRSAREG